MTGVVIVTGASRGIGAATAKMLARAGYGVAVNFHSGTREAEAVVAEIKEAGGRALAIQADTSIETDVVRLFETVDRELGPLTGLVNNAGISGGTRLIQDVDAKMLNAVMAINVVGCFLCAREAVRRMSTKLGGKGGAIVNVSSKAAVLGGGGEWIHYAASKGALDTMTTGLAVELGRQGIRVNAVRPGMIETEFHASGLPNRAEKIIPTVPFGRIGTVEEVANAIVWLLSDQASYLSGALIDVSGGR